jgi:creatinine amidohydrolase
VIIYTWVAAIGESVSCLESMYKRVTRVIMPAITGFSAVNTQTTMKHGVNLESISWVAAEKWFSRDPVLVIPLGAAAKEHGPHLPLNNDALIANWLADEVRKRLPVVIAPLINASYYPAFVEYPGSISLKLETARDLIVDICSSLSAFGVKKFYVLNTGISTEAPLSQVKEKLPDNVDFKYLQLNQALQTLPENLLQQTYGSHADEHETSLMMYIAPEVVDMSKAVDDGSQGEGRLTRNRGQGTWSESGVFGQPSLATVEKGRAVAQALINQVLKDIKDM